MASALPAPSATHFADLSRGYGGPVAVDILIDTQLNKHLLLIAHIAEAWPGPRQERDAALAILDEARVRNPQYARELLTHPMVGAWATRTIRRLRGAAEDWEQLGPDLGQLSALAAVAASRSQVDADLVIPARRHAVLLPTLGMAIADHPVGPVRVQVRSGEIALGDGVSAIRVPPVSTADTPGWYGVSQLTAEPTPARLGLEDLNPYRDLFHVRPASRVKTEEVDRWRQLFAEAWHLLTGHATDRAAEIACGLHCVVPLVPDRPGEGRSATARHAFGAFGMTPPASAVELLVAMVHEFQHSKLNAIQDLVPLFTRDDGNTYFAPWRADPRPAGALLQGVYAFLAVADVANRLRGVPHLRESAEKQFAIIREQLRPAVEPLRELSTLTSWGRRFVAGLEGSIARLDATDIPSASVNHAKRSLHLNRTAWLERNGSGA